MRLLGEPFGEEKRCFIRNVALVVQGRIEAAQDKSVAFIEMNRRRVHILGLDPEAAGMKVARPPFESSHHCSAHTLPARVAIDVQV